MDGRTGHRTRPRHLEADGWRGLRGDAVAESWIHDDGNAIAGLGPARAPARARRGQHAPSPLG